MNRRHLLKSGLLSSAALLSLPSLAQAQGFCGRGEKTPRQAKGPFYPVVDQVDTDADLIFVNGSKTQAKGKVVIIEGMLRDQACQPVPGALVEIWQACESGRYDHPSDPNTAPVDPEFQYWGKAVTNVAGIYRFRTIIPGAYPADTDWMRPPHIHFKVSKLGYSELITQMYFKGEEYNAKDLILQNLSKEDQGKVVVEFTKREELPHPVGVFDIQIVKIIRGNSTK